MIKTFSIGCQSNLVNLNISLIQVKKKNALIPLIIYNAVNIKFAAVLQGVYMYSKNSY